MRRRLLDLRAVPNGVALRFPCDRSIGFHVALAGDVFVHADGLEAPLHLAAGDVAVMGRGCDHRLAAHDSIRGLPVETIATGQIPTPTPARTSTVISGAYQLWNAPLHPFFTELPPWFVMRARSSASLEPLALVVAMLADESRRDDLGRDSVLHGLLDVAFTMLLRAVVAEQPTDRGSWSHAIRDPQVHCAVSRLHDECASPWTLESLAREVGLSRSVLAERFRDQMGTTPLAYLRTVRLQRATHLLTTSTFTLEQIASAVGYHDAFSFSKAFKKATTLSPGEYRRRDMESRNDPFRFAPEEAVSFG
ncbi:MAG: AraC family transcriptional regulator [Gemmatimonadaceae bacterium]|nr:AraC family transcriptional regulator [Gemmatimonadaceae bacterium]